MWRLPVFSILFRLNVLNSLEYSCASYRFPNILIRFLRGWISKFETFSLKQVFWQTEIVLFLNVLSFDPSKQKNESKSSKQAFVSVKIGVKSLFAEPFPQVWEQNTVTYWSLILGNMEDKRFIRNPIY